MCLEKDRALSEEFLDENRRKGINVINAYKALLFVKELYGPYFHEYVGEMSLKSPYFGMKYQVGYNKAGSFKELTYNATETKVHEGIHVYLTKTAATLNRTLSGNQTIVMVQCLVADFLGRSAASLHDEEAAFSKVYLSQEEYDQAFRRKREGMVFTL